MLVHSVLRIEQGDTPVTYVLASENCGMGGKTTMRSFRWSVRISIYASNLRAMASYLEAMASTVLEKNTFVIICIYIYVYNQKILQPYLEEGS